MAERNFGGTYVKAEGPSRTFSRWIGHRRPRLIVAAGRDRKRTETAGRRGTSIVRANLTLAGLLVFAMLLTACGASTEANPLSENGRDSSPPLEVTVVMDEAPSATPDQTETPEPTPTTEPTQTISPELTAVEIKRRLEPSTVMVVAKVGGSNGNATMYTGSGFVFNESGQIITNAHVIEGAASVEVYFSGNPKPVTATILGRSTCDDLAVLQIHAANLQAVELGAAGELEVGQAVVALGYPGASQAGEEIQVTQGIISRVGVDADHWKNAIQIDAAINGGNSGGPLVNAAGEVIGINSASRINAEGINFAINIHTALSTINTLATGVDQDWIGMELVPNNSELAAKLNLASDRGMFVTFVTPGGPADEAGLVAGDVILTMEGLAVSSMSDVCDVVKTHSVHGFPQVGLAEPVAEVNTEPTATQEPAAVETPADEAGSDIAVFADYDFEDGTAPWAAGSYGDYTLQVQNGALELNFAGEEPSMHAFLVPDSDQVSNGAIVAEVEMNGVGEAGIVAHFESSDDSGWTTHMCSISTNGKFSCWSSKDHNFTELAGWQASSAIDVDGINGLAIVIQGADVSFLINGEVVATFSDQEVSGGMWGLFVQGYETGFQARFNQVAVLQAAD